MILPAHIIATTIIAAARETAPGNPGEVALMVAGSTDRTGPHLTLNDTAAGQARVYAAMALRRALPKEIGAFVVSNAMIARAVGAPYPGQYLSIRWKEQEAGKLKWFRDNAYSRVLDATEAVLAPWLVAAKRAAASSDIPPVGPGAAAVRRFENPNKHDMLRELQQAVINTGGKLA